MYKDLFNKQWDKIQTMELSSSQYDLLTEVLKLERQKLAEALLNN
jgi:hypothetical protein